MKANNLGYGIEDLIRECVSFSSPGVLKIEEVPTNDMFEGKKFPEIKKLNINLEEDGYSGNLLLPESIKNLTNLQQIEISTSVDTVPIFPNSISNLTNLKELSIFFRDGFDDEGGLFDITIHRSIEHLVNLEKLIVCVTGLSTIVLRLPNSIENLKNLRRLNIEVGEEDDVYLPNTIGDLKILRVLGFRGSDYGSVSIPSSFENLQNLVKLYLPNGMSAFDYLDYKKERSFNLGGLKLREIPYDIFMIRDLEELDVSNNYLTRITTFVAKVSNLKKLDLRNNPFLKELPDFIWKMPSLEEVMIDYKLEKIVLNLKIQESILKFVLTGKNHEKWNDDQLKRAVKLRINGIPFS